MKAGTMSAISKLITYLEEAPELNHIMINPDHQLPKLIDEFREEFTRLEVE